MKKLSNKEFAKRFGKVAQRYDEISNSYTVSRRYNETVKYLKGSCLEIGCGTGNLSQQSTNHVLSDISFNMTKVSKKKFKCQTICCDAEKLPFRNKSFGTIILSEVIYYLNNPADFIREAYRVLKKNGRLIISSANQDMIIYDKIRFVLRSIGFRKMYFDDGSRSFFNLNNLRNLLKKNRFNVIFEKKLIMIPFKPLHTLNLIIEKTFLRYFCIFILVVAEKK